MANPEIRFPDDLVRRMQKHRTIQWDSFLHQAVRRKLDEIEVLEAIATKSKLTEEQAEELGHLVKAGQRRRLHKAG
jgi:hypothetical protein